MTTALVTIECREYFTIEVEIDETLGVDYNNPAIHDAYHSGDWGNSEDIQSDIINIEVIKEKQNG